MSAPPNATGAASAPTVTYPHLGTLLIAAGIGLTTFAATANAELPRTIAGILAGAGASASAVGLFLLGRASV